MLVLTRKSNQSIMIGDNIEVSVLSVMGDKVRIGIQAPQDIPVFRTEIYEEIHRQGEAPQSTPGTPATEAGADGAAAEGAVEQAGDPAEPASSSAEQ